MYDSSVPFTVEQINFVENNGIALADFRDFYSRFPDQDFDTAVGGCKMEMTAKAAGLTPALEVDTQVNPDAPVPPESGPEAEVEAVVSEVVVSAEETVSESVDASGEVVEAVLEKTDEGSVTE